MVKRKDHIGVQIRRIRQAREITLLELANKMGIKWQQLQHIELTGRASVASIEQIATALQHGIIIFPLKIKSS